MEESARRVELIKERLVVDESEVFGRVLSRVEHLLMLDSEGGIHLRGSKADLTQRHLIGLYLVGRKFAEMAGLAETDTATADELSAFLGTSPSAVSARITELKSEGKVESVRRAEWRIRYPTLESLLDEIEMALGGSIREH